MQTKSSLTETFLFASLSLVISLGVQAQQLNAQEEAEEKVIQIAPAAGADDFADEPQTRIVQEPTYWIGIRGRSIESAVLRTHLQLAEEMGVVVEDIIPDSPAAMAGLRKHDIILRANGDAVDNMQILQTQVRVGKDKPLELTIIRLGKEEKVVVVPELRPEDLTGAEKSLPGFDRGGVPGDLLHWFGQPNFGNRNIGPGIVFRGGGPQRFDFNKMPNDVSVSIQRRNNGPAQITVQKGDQTWQIQGDDQESLKQLPEDLRPFVQRMLKGQNGFAPGAMGFDLNNFDFNQELEQMLPRGLGNFHPGLGAGPDPTQKRIDELEKKLQKLMQRLEEE